MDELRRENPSSATEEKLITNSPQLLNVTSVEQDSLQPPNTGSALSVGNFHNFEGNSQRAEIRPRYDLIPFAAIIGLANRFTLGLKYGENNWKSGGPEFFKEAKNHLIHHLWCYLEGRLEDEPSRVAHLESVLWNAGILLYWETEGKQKWEDSHPSG